MGLAHLESVDSKTPKKFLRNPPGGDPGPQESGCVPKTVLQLPFLLEIPVQSWGTSVLQYLYFVDKCNNIDLWTN